MKRIIIFLMIGSIVFTGCASASSLTKTTSALSTSSSEQVSSVDGSSSDGASSTQSEPVAYTNTFHFSDAETQYNTLLAAMQKESASYTDQQKQVYDLVVHATNSIGRITGENKIDQPYKNIASFNDDIRKYYSKETASSYITTEKDRLSESDGKIDFSYQDCPIVLTSFSALTVTLNQADSDGSAEYAIHYLNGHIEYFVTKEAAKIKMEDGQLKLDSLFKWVEANYYPKCVSNCITEIAGQNEFNDSNKDTGYFFGEKEIQVDFYNVKFDLNYKNTYTDFIANLRDKYTKYTLLSCDAVYSDDTLASEGYYTVDTTIKVSVVDKLGNTSVKTIKKRFWVGESDYKVTFFINVIVLSES